MIFETNSLASPGR